MELPQEDKVLLWKSEVEAKNTGLEVNGTLHVII